MERFVVIHGVRSGFSQDEIWEGCHAAATGAVKGAKWLCSYYVPERDELICDWEAPDEAAVLESLDAADTEHLIPVKHIYSAVYLDPAFFK